jgi:hypothetical protein
MGKFLAVVVTWLMVLVALGQGGPGGSGGSGGSGGPGGQPTLSAQFNLNDWMTNEPATDKNHFPDQLPAVEGNTITVVYDKGGSAQIQLFFRNNNPDQDFIGQLIVEDARYIHDAAPLPVPWGAPPPVTIPDTILSAPTVALNIAKLATAPATLTISGLPAFVTKGHIQLQMRAEGNFGAQVAGSQSLVPWSGGLTSQKVLITYAPPTGVMVPVWTEVAELSCTMAQGEANLFDIKRELAKGLYFGNLFAYNLGTASAVYYTSERKFKLKKFLDHIAPSGPGPGNAAPGNCFDVNSFLIILHHSQGVAASGHRVYLGTEGDELEAGEFVTNLFCLIGSDPLDNTLFVRVYFILHFQCIVAGTVSDAAIGYWNDLVGQVHRNPAWAWYDAPSWQVVSGLEAYGLTLRRRLAEDSAAYHLFHPFPVAILSSLDPIQEDRISQGVVLTGVILGN